MSSFKSMFGIGVTRLSEGDAPEAPDAQAHDRLSWLLDAPLFIDEHLVDRLFDAVVRPTYEIKSREVGSVSEESRRRLFGGEASAGAKTGLPFVGKADVSLKIKSDRELTSRATASDKIVISPVVTPGRRLEEIALVTLSEFPQRVTFLSSSGSARDFQGRSLSIEELVSEAATAPRMLTFIDVEPDTPIIPMACELASGRTQLLYQRYAKRLWSEREKAPSFPEDADASRETRRAYWKELSDRFSSRVATEIVEEASIGPGGNSERLAWIDFRIPIGAEHTLHLHCVPDGRVHTGVFAYNMVRRGFRHGIKVVGTMKAGLALNALAVFDR
jgi:hypothetical protein